MTTKTRNRGVKSRWYPTLEQEHFLNRQWGCARLVYNKGREYRQDQWRDQVEVVITNDHFFAGIHWRSQFPHSRVTSYHSSCPHGSE